MKKKPILILLLLLTVTIGTLLFIKYNNDHAECEETIVLSKDVNGSAIQTKQHICKEAFSL